MTDEQEFKLLETLSDLVATIDGQQKQIEALAREVERIKRSAALLGPIG